MGKVFERVQSRRDFFAATLRYTVLAACAAGGVLAGVKRYRLVKEGRCVRGGVCSGCDVFERCALPEALSAKAVLDGGGDASGR